MFCGIQEQYMPCNTNKIKKIQNYLFKYSNKIGSGNFSEVYEGVDQKNNQPVAVKVIQVSAIKSKILSTLLQTEIDILKILNHPKIIKCYDVLTSVNNCYIITEFCENGDLEKILKKTKKFQEKDIYKIAYDIYKGMLYLSSQNIIHRDLKIANIFMDGNGNAKIADFGFAVKSKTLFKDIHIGSPIYMSPEGLLNRQYGPKTDIWSFGIILYQLLHGDTPLSYCKTQQQLKEGVLKPLKFKVQISPQIKQFIQSCMNTSQKARTNIYELQQTPYLRKITILVQGVKLHKQLASTYHSTQQSKQLQQLFTWILSYQDAVSLVHYCRLVHKTASQCTSIVLSQWLLTLSCELARATIDSRCEKISKITQVINEYYRKYQKQHLVPRYQRTIQQAIIETNNLLKTQKCKINIQILLKQNEILRKYLRGISKESFSVNSQSQIFLSKKI